ncbi:MAG: 50S ribosomal protein L32e [Methanosarcinaceae archaeon]|nr:50S ribosomal protein L32e [Methanosarcinaceae archaeon]
MSDENSIEYEVSSEQSSEFRRLFNVRKVQKRKKPAFNRYCYTAFKRLSPSWRRPRGLQSKQRRGIVSKGPTVKVGYRTPVAVRGLHPSGYDEILIHNPDELVLVDSEYEAIRIGSKVGARKKAMIEERAAEFGIKVLNPSKKE